MAVVVLPSPALVGVIAVTQTSFPSGCVPEPVERRQLDLGREPAVRLELLGEEPELGGKLRNRTERDLDLDLEASCMPGASRPPARAPSVRTRNSVRKSRSGFRTGADAGSARLPDARRRERHRSASVRLFQRDPARAPRRRAGVVRAAGRRDRSRRRACSARSTSSGSSTARKSATWPCSPPTTRTSGASSRRCAPCPGSRSSTSPTGRSCSIWAASSR